MSSKFPWKQIRSTIGFRIAAGYSALVLLSVFTLMVIAHLFLSSTLVTHDRNRVAAEWQSLHDRYIQGGLELFDATALKNDSSRKNNPFFTRILDSSGRTAKIYFSQYWLDFDLAALERSSAPRSGTWMTLPSLNQRYELEILSGELPDGFRFQVGISTEDRQSVLRRLRETLILATIPLMALGLGGGALLAHRTLRPVRHLIQTVTSIHSGRMDARVPRTHNGDELDELGRLFNEMIARIRLLIQGMKGALDAVAHDLRTPMTRFRNLAEDALQDEASLQKYREALQDCVEESDHILRMLNMLMDISEAETGTLQLNRREIDFSVLVENVAEMYRYVAEEKGIDVRTSIPPRIRLTLDPERITQTLANLLDNAVKYTPPGGLVNLAVTIGEQQIRIQVADTGIGIEPVDLDRIWDRLYRGRHDNTNGIGLGLSLVRAVVMAHGGQVTARNRPDGGSIFEMVLPATAVPV